MILIPNLEMPKMCNECPCMNDGACYAILEDCCRGVPFSYSLANHARQPYCPLIEIKPGFRIVHKAKPSLSEAELITKYYWLND